MWQSTRTACDTEVGTSLPAGMAKLADAADLKSADPKGLWGFKSPSRHHLTYCWIMLYRGVLFPCASLWKLLVGPQRDVNVT